MIRNVTHFFSLLWILTFASGAGWSLESEWNLAVFSSQQRLWNDPAAIKSKVAVLPFYVKNYREKTPCDSCRYLSPENVEFVTENSLTQIFRKMLPDDSVYLVAPSDGRFRAGNFQLMDSLRLVEFPFGKYFKSYIADIVCYSDDALTPVDTRTRLSAIAGRLDADYLLVIRDVSMELDPVRSDKAKGQFNWRGKLVFWAVGKSRPEWVLNFGFKATDHNLNQRLEEILENRLIEYLQNFYGGCGTQKSTPE